MKRQPKFLPEDYNILLQKIAELEGKVSQAGQEMGAMTEQSSESYHDNAPYDIARQQFDNLAEELGQLIVVRNQAIVVDKPNSNKTVQIGHTVIIEDKKTGTKQKVLVAGEMVK